MRSQALFAVVLILQISAIYALQYPISTSHSVVRNAATNPTTPPTVIKHFKSNLTMTYSSQSLYGWIWYDAPNSRNRFFTSIPYPAAPWQPLNQTTLQLPNAQYQIVNEQCRDIGGKFGDWFGWVPYSQYYGQVVVDGRMCDEWYLESNSEILVLDVVAGTSQPVRYAVYVSNTNGDLSLIISYTFGSDFQTEFDERVFTVSPDCRPGAIVCPLGPVIPMEMYRFHPNGDYSLTNHNTADLLGDVAYLCMTEIVGQDNLLSLFQMQVNTTWGQYGLCNGGVCLGGSPNTVGKATMGNLLFFSGQCRNTSADYGTWYSLDGSSQCPPGSPVGTNGCAWQEIKRVKTVDLNCLVNLGLRKTCLVQDGHAPFTNSVQLVQKAFASSDPSQGGCPDVPPPPSAKR